MWNDVGRLQLVHRTLSDPSDPFRPRRVVGLSVKVMACLEGIFAYFSLHGGIDG